VRLSFAFFLSQGFSQLLSFLSIAIGAFVGIGVILTTMILIIKNKLVNQSACKVKINDGALTKMVKGGSTLLSALSTQGIQLPSPCGGKAACKQCRIQILDGVEPPLETDKATFTRKELECGWRLSCQAKVKHDLHLHVEERFLSVKEWKAKVVSNENVATFIKELVVELPEGETVPYKAGGYLQFHVPPFKTSTSSWKETMRPQFYGDWEKYKLFNQTIDFSQMSDGSVIRAYSMASYPAEGRLLKFNIRIATPPQGGDLPWGICSSYAFSLKKGDEVRLSGPFGESFMLEGEKPLIFLIGGAGSSFGRSHVMQLFKTEGTKRRVDFWYGARSMRENIYQKEYEELSKAFPHFHYHLVLSEPLPEDLAAGWPKDDPVRTNYLFRAFEQGQLKHLTEPEECHYFVCGPPLHNSSVLKLLDEYGVPRSHIVLDDFGS
jgi:Na+-transporting NADH:ubiquinone oxidoreductase subunit F